MSDRTLREIEADPALMAWVLKNVTWEGRRKHIDAALTQHRLSRLDIVWIREWFCLPPLDSSAQKETGWLPDKTLTPYEALCLIRSAFVRELDANGSGVYLTSQGTYIVERGRGQGADSTVEELGSDGVFHEFDPGRDPESDADGAWQTRAQAEMVAMRTILKEKLKECKDETPKRTR